MNVPRMRQPTMQAGDRHERDRQQRLDEVGDRVAAEDRASAIGSERKRSTAWFLRSLAMLMATPKALNTSVWAMIPPIRNSR